MLRTINLSFGVKSVDQAEELVYLLFFSSQLYQRYVIEEKNPNAIIHYTFSVTIQFMLFVFLKLKKITQYKHMDHSQGQLRQFSRQ